MIMQRRRFFKAEPSTPEDCRLDLRCFGETSGDKCCDWFYKMTRTSFDELSRSAESSQSIRENLQEVTAGGRSEKLVQQQATKGQQQEAPPVKIGRRKEEREKRWALPNPSSPNPLGTTISLGLLLILLAGGLLVLGQSTTTTPSKQLQRNSKESSTTTKTQDSSNSQATVGGGGRIKAEESVAGDLNINQMKWSPELIKPTAVGQQLIKKSTMEEVNSADLPAEFRDSSSDDSGQPEASQSRLVRLCKQTTSVLASVLPAPFGGHKRSVLCQFFGQVPFSLAGSKRQTVPQQPGTGIELQQNQPSISILHQHEQKPVTLLTSGLHPLEIVLRHQQEQLRQQQQQQQLRVQRPEQDLKESASILDYAYHQRVEPPSRNVNVKSVTARHQDQIRAKSEIKFSAPITDNSFKPLGMKVTQSSTSGVPGAWSIFSHNFDSEPSTSSAPVSSGVVSTLKVVSSSNNSTNSTGSEGKRRPEMSALVMGKPPSSRKSAGAPTEEPAVRVSIAKRTEALKSTTPRMELSPNSTQSPQPVAPGELVNVRTIEVEAQQTSNETISSAETSSSTTPKPLADPHQVQKREELVIASINNLTRIAFGNHLRDTVKVINKLIDQQASLFGPKIEEQMMTAESGEAAKLTTIKLTLGGKSTTTGKSLVSTASKSARQKQLPSTLAYAGAGVKPTKRPAGVGKKSPGNKTMAIITTTTTSTIKPEVLLVKKITQTTPFGVHDAKTTARPVDRKWTVSARAESRRLSTINSAFSQSSGPNYNRPVSRALSFPSSASPFVSREQTQSTSSIEFDPMKVAASTMVDLQRDNSRFSTNQPMNSIRAQRHKPNGPSLPVGLPNIFRPMVHPSASTKPTKAIKQTFEQTTSESKYPWLVPDKSIVSELLGGSFISSAAGSSWSESDRKSSFSGYKPSSAFTKWSVANWGDGGSTTTTTKKFPSPSLKLFPEKALIKSHSKASDKPTYYGPSKMDSLTTLKMSLMTTTATSTSTTTTTQPPSTSQSRWIPTITRALPVYETTSTTTTTPQPTSTIGSTTSASSLAETTKAARPSANTQSVSDMIEARASDTVSRYTIHLNEANELLATTRRYYAGSLPQIANTGEFFSAETIATWPERYQTMLDSLQSTPSLQQKSTSQSLETTRRNGEAFDDLQSTASTTKAVGRHRISESPESIQRTTVSVVPEVSQTASLTILPANHKLTLQEEALTTTRGKITSRQQQMMTTLALASTTSRPETSPQLPSTQQAYTLMGPFSQEPSMPEEMSTTIKFPILVSLDTERNNHTTNAHNQLRPPYLAPEGDNQGVEVNYEPESKPHVSRKLYELLVPPSRSFVGSQNPLNTQKFNLSALKFLAQSLLSSPSSNETSNRFGHLPYLSPRDEQQEPIHNASQQLRLLELLNITLPSSYYDFLDSNEQSTSQSKNATSDKSTIFNKATNLLSDLRRLEQKKAAAILAAIRYQVPGPLVRPWDLASDLYTQAAFISDRFDTTDDETELRLASLKDNFLSAYLSNALKSPMMLNKQRVVPRAELEARLKSRPSYENHRMEPAHINAYGEHEQEYSLIDHNQRPESKRNLTRSLLDRLLNIERKPWSLSGPDDYNNRTNDFDLINLTVNNNNNSNNSNERASLGEVEFIDTDNSKHFRYTDDTKQAIPAKQHTSDLNPKHYVNSSVKNELIHSTIGSKEDTFDCSQRQAGFYPDANSACQTFYHCSNTGHLLTFNCPQQTRFDENSLKCGPWFEVPCRSSRRH